MEAKEFSGKTTEEALQRAQEHFGLSLGQLEVEVVSAGSDGIFGLLGKKAVVRVRPQGKSAAEEVAEMVALVTEGQKPAPARAARPAPTPPPAPRPAPAPAPAKPATPAAPAAPAMAAAAPVPPPPLPAPAPAPEEDEEPEDEEFAEASGEGRPRLEEDPEVLAFAQQVLGRLVQSLDDQAAVSAASGEQGLELEVTGGESGMLIGRRGQTLDALQYLATRIVSHRWGRAVRVYVDAGGYRRRRRQYLEETARRMADKARQNHKPVSIGPLNAQERRVVHLVLRSERGISTASRGRGELKKVVISPR